MTGTGPPPRWTNAVEYRDMWLDPADDPREAAPAGPAAPVGTDEQGVLLDYLRRYRLTLQLKCADLDAEQLARRSVPPSTMSLLGLVRHMADVERSWFRRGLAGEDVPPRYYSDTNRDGDFDDAVADDEIVADAWRSWRDEVAFAEQFVLDHRDWDFERVDPLGRRVQLRDVVVHLLEEYARHCGHADLLREAIDGRIGQ